MIELNSISMLSQAGQGGRGGWWGAVGEKGAHLWSRQGLWLLERSGGPQRKDEEQLRSRRPAGPPTIKHLLLNPEAPKDLFCLIFKSSYLKLCMSQVYSLGVCPLNLYHWEQVRLQRNRSQTRALVQRRYQTARQFQTGCRQFPLLSVADSKGSVVPHWGSLYHESGLEVWSMSCPCGVYQGTRCTHRSQYRGVRRTWTQHWRCQVNRDLRASITPWEQWAGIEPAELGKEVRHRKAGKTRHRKAQDPLAWKTQGNKPGLFINMSPLNFLKFTAVSCSGLDLLHSTHTPGVQKSCDP